MNRYNGAREELISSWGKRGEEVIRFCEEAQPFNDTFEHFLDHCFACGGNWCGMLLTGIKELYPVIYDIIPDEMGSFAWNCVCDVLILLGVQLPTKN